MPFFFRRRYPFGAPVAVGVLIAAVSFVDSGLVSDEFVMFLSGITIAFMFGMLRERNQAVAGAAFLVGIVAVVAHNQGDHPGDFVFPSIVFGVAWIVGLRARLRSSRRAQRRRNAPSASSASARNRRGSRSPRSGRGSRASCTTSSATASAS